ncbi:MAG TPA: alcohol dehydrogenase catalytic domain-containing protein [Thermoanaerobaculia bacterium]|nr:alcohol dehydrogenase catalytic domain-containing protein [Thermoanaerobaculia bacterium]
MRAIRLIRTGAPLEERDIPDLQPRPGEIVVDIRAAGICHSDAHYRAGGGRVTLPLTLGHEIAGVVRGTGQRVALHYLLENGDMLGKERDGGYAESICVAAGNAVPIPDEVAFEHAAIMMCSTATAWHALRLAGIRAGESLAIIGFGGLGVSAIQLARVLGVADIQVLDVVAEKLRLAATFGASTELRQADVALEFSGNAAAALNALRHLKPGGRLIIVAINLRRLEIDPYADVLARERHIIGCSDHTRDELFELMGIARRGEIDLSRAITRRVPLQAASINAVLDDLDRGTEHLRTVIPLTRPYTPSP